MSNLSESLEPIVNRIGELNKVQRYAIFIGAIVVMVGLFVWLGYMPKRDDINRLSARVERLEVQLNDAKNKARDLDKVKRDLEEANVQFEVVKRTLPEQKDIPSLLESITSAGRESGLEFVLFKPLPERVMEFYAEIPVDIRMEGHYHSLAVFFDRVARLPRIVNIRDITIRSSGRGDSDRLAATCRAVTYRFVDAPPPAAKKPQRGRR